MNRLLSLWLLALLLLATEPCFAQQRGPATIVVVQPSGVDAAADETFRRVVGELSADGFRVTTTPFEGKPDRERLGALATSLPQAVALVGLFGTDHQTTVELWVVDRVTDKVVVTRVEVSADTGREPSKQVAPEVLSRRAVEVLRATLLLLRIAPQAPVAPKQSEPPAPAERQPAEQPSRPARRFSAEMGLGVTVLDFDVLPAASPLLRLRALVVPHLSLRLTATGFGTEPTLTRSNGRARLSHQLALLELAATPWERSRLRPLLTLGAGASHVSVEAAASPPFQASTEEQWSLAADAGAGLLLALSERWSLSLEGHGLVSSPYPVVRFVGQEVARLGQPSLLASLTLGGWL